MFPWSKETEENNRMGKTRDLFKKIRDTNGTFHAKMGSIKDRNGTLGRAGAALGPSARRPPSSRAEGLLFLHGLESNPGSSLQTEEEAGLP